MDRPELQYYFDFSSPYAYLGACRIESIARSVNARLVWKPILLGGVFKHLGGPMVPLMAGPQVKQDYTMTDMRRWAQYFNIPFNWPSEFPMNTIKALRIAIQLENPAVFIQRTYRAYWAEDQDINDPDTLAALLSDLGMSQELLDRAADPVVKQMLIDATQEAIDIGIFGAPTCAVGGELYFGQDRFQFVKAAVERHTP
ncbi:MAG: 2-hydroxychromene-2-carboxylate isomerase [Myxococcota bacterium]|nr:2-hydroxychromene-2-carboxylate isomerase [Myxococcota bacterium]